MMTTHTNHSILPKLHRAIDRRRWARAEAIALNYLRQAAHEQIPAQRLVAIAGLLVGVLQTGDE